MGCQCFKDNNEGQNSESSLKNQQEYSQQRLHLNAGQTQIEVQNGNLQENDAQLLVSAIDDRGKAVGNPLFKKHQIQAEFDENQLRQGQITPIQMKQDRTLLLLVLPLWRGGHHNEESILEHAVKKLIEHVSDKLPRSIAMDEIGVKRFGFPRQIVIKILVREFSKFFEAKEQNNLQSIQFMSNEMCTVNMFEVEIRKYVQLQNVLKDEKTEKIINRKNELEQPLLE